MIATTFYREAVRLLQVKVVLDGDSRSVVVSGWG